MIVKNIKCVWVVTSKINVWLNMRKYMNMTGAFIRVALRRDWPNRSTRLPRDAHEDNHRSRCTLKGHRRHLVCKTHAPDSTGAREIYNSVNTDGGRGERRPKTHQMPIAVAVRAVSPSMKRSEIVWNYPSRGRSHKVLKSYYFLVRRSTLRSRRHGDQ